MGKTKKLFKKIRHTKGKFRAKMSSIKEKQMFFWNSLAFDDLKDVGNLISGSSAFSKSTLNIWKFSVHVLLKPSLENVEHHFASV